MSGISRNRLANDKFCPLIPCSYHSRTLPIIRLQPSFDPYQSHQPNNTTIFSGILLFLMVSLLFPYGLNSMVNRQMTPLIPLLLSLVTVYTQITILAASNSLPITDLIWKKNNYIKYHFTFVTAFLKYSLTACQQSCYIFVVHWLSSLGDYFTPFPLPWTFSHLFYHLHDPILLNINTLRR